MASDPGINAAGRLDHMKAGIELLTTLDEVEAQALAKRLDKTNEERKDIQMDIVDEAVLQVKADLADAGDAGQTLFSILAYDPEWHEGVVGIVAGRIKEDRHRPTIVMCDASDGDIKGSGRSIPGFHLKHALDRINIEHPGILKKFGGHAMAAGMTIDRARLDEFKEALERVCRDEIAPELLIKRLRHDGEFPADAFTVEDVRKLSMEVWGQGFEEPVFVNEIDVTGVKLIGELKNHLKLDGSLHGQSAAVLGFGLGDLAECVPEKISIAFKPQVNNFRGESTLQLLIDHIPESLNPGLDEILAENEEAKTQQELIRVARMRQEKLALNPSQDKVKISVATPDFDVQEALEAKAKNLGLADGAGAQGPVDGAVVGAGASQGATAQVGELNGDGADAPGQKPDQAGKKRGQVRKGLAETVAAAAAAADAIEPVASAASDQGSQGPELPEVSVACAPGADMAGSATPAPLPPRRYVPRARRVA